MENNITNNLFYYATSELSQDAFICWFLSHLLCENADSDAMIQSCARDFMKLIMPEFGDTDCIDAVLKQVNNIDVLIRVGEKHIIIEDKTFTDTHDDQINRYRKSLINNGINSENIICVYYKIMNQSKPEKNIDYELTRGDLLKLFGKYAEVINNAVFSDYYKYLQYIDDKVNSYKTKPIIEWNDESYIGMFTELESGLLKSYNPDWGYVPNPTGGFMGMWWHGLSDELDKIGIDAEVIDELYPQIENNYIAIKISSGSDESKKALATDFRWKFFEYFREKLGEKFIKKTFRQGKYMTVGLIEYNETNYVEMISKINELIRELPDEWRKVE